MNFPRPLHLGMAAIAGVAVGGTAVYFWRSTAQHQLQQQHQQHQQHPALKHGAPITSNFRVFSSYVAEYDPRLRNPKYVLEHFTADVLTGNGNRSDSNFKEDRSLEARFRGRIDDFRKSGYDRGHMAPASNHKRSQDAMDDTFILTNISPQVRAFNQGYWARFERFVQEVAGRSKDVYVVTGPLYLPQPSASGWTMHHPMLGTPPRLVAVPTHFYKVMLAEGSKEDGSGGSTVIVGAFVMPNARIDPKTPLAAFAVPVSSLEEAAGIQFYPEYLNKERRQAIDDVALQWQGVGHSEMTTLKLLPGKESFPLLPSSTTTTTASSSSSSHTAADGNVGAPINWRPGTLKKHGMQHVCEHNGCRLPVERWWEANKKRNDNKDSGSLRRTKSAFS